MSAFVGQTVILPCRTSPGKSVVWWYREHQDASVHDIFNVRGDVMNGFKDSGRFAVIRDVEDNYSLVIENISLSDAGLYTCVIDDGYGERFITRINVSGRSCQYRTTAYCIIVYMIYRWAD